MDIKYIVYRQKAEYGWVGNLELSDHNDVLLDREISNKFLYLINRIWTSATINQIVKIPFQSVWFRFYIDEKRLNPDKEYIFMFEEGSRPYLIKEYLQYLRKKYYKSHIVLAALNSSFTFPQKRLYFFESQYDFITSFDREDCIKRGWGLYTGVYSKLKDIDFNRHFESDLLFVGEEKGRLDLLYNIYDKLTTMGLKCIFYVNKVPKEKIRPNSGFHFNEWLNYKDVVKMCCQTRCLLEIVQEGQHGATYRHGEAVAYGIKLLTNYRPIINERYYNPEQMKLFNTPEDIDVSYIKEDYSPSQYEYNGILAPYKRLEWLESVLVNKCAL